MHCIKFFYGHSAPSIVFLGFITEKTKCTQARHQDWAHRHPVARIEQNLNFYQTRRRGESAVCPAHASTGRRCVTNFRSLGRPCCT